jgi:hypothetical protein
MESTIATASLAAAASAAGPNAARTAARDAITGLARPAGLLLVFPTSGSAEKAAADAVAVAGGTPVAGLTGNAVIGGQGPHEEGCSAIAFSDEVDVGIGTASEPANLREAARNATGRALDAVDIEAGHPLVLLFLDTRSGDQAEAIAGAYDAAGPGIPLAGGAAGGAEPMQIVGAQALSRTLVAIAIVSPRPVGVGIAHGCRMMDVPSIVTASRERRLLELDGRPAVDVYLERLGLADIELGDEEFEALAVTHPLAQPELGGEQRIRHVLGRDGDALVCGTHLPPNAAIEFTSEAPEDIIAASGQAVGEAIAAVGSAPPRAVLIFDCAGRKRAVGDAIGLEVQALLDALERPLPPVAGLFTHGEVARVRGAKGDRNHAVVVVAFS